MKGREMTYGVEPLRSGAMFTGDKIHFGRLENLIGHIRMLAVKRLATDDDESLLARDSSSGPQYVINLLLLH
jgi:hypothetical protein